MIPTTVDDTIDAAGEPKASRRLFVYNGGFLTQGRVRRILELDGWSIRLGKPGPDDWIGVWGKSPTSPRGEAVAEMTDAPVLRVEDAFLRSVLPGRDGTPPLGLCLDRRGVHFDSSTVSDLEDLLANHPLDNTALLNRARDGADRLAKQHLSKYNAFDPATPLPDGPFVLVIDQTKGDASIEHSGADALRFKEMLYWAQEDFLGAKILIKTHPETEAGHREGHFGPEDETDLIKLLRDPVSPWALMESALAVYTVSSQLGFEAIYAGHRPRVFGQPFYAGWGLTEDHFPIQRRQRQLTKAQLFAGAMILYPKWYDPYRDRLCELEEAVDTLEAETRAWRDDHHGYVATGMRRWKQAPLQRFFGDVTPVQFADDADAARTIANETGRRHMVWASKDDSANPADIRIEDGFIRSAGLGAQLVPPLSLVADDLGIYYDPTRESRLERLIMQTSTLSDHDRQRAADLVRTLCDAGLSKYNLQAATMPTLPPGRRILVPGQVEDDASVQLGCDTVKTNADLLAQARAAHPDAVLIYKPHPDVEAGLRPGTIDAGAADVIARNADPIALIAAVDEVWTMSSLLGFEALIRGKPVTCLGTPFYAGWGLTTDLGKVPARRQARPDITALAHAVLIGYPRYFDPVTGRPCPPEVVAERLARGEIPAPGRGNRIVSKLQGWFAGFAHLWR